MSETSKEAHCGLCGARPARGKIAFAHESPANYKREHPGQETAALDMALCPACGDRVLKHLKRIFTRAQLGLGSKPPSHRGKLPSSGEQ